MSLKYVAPNRQDMAWLGSTELRIVRTWRGLEVRGSDLRSHGMSLKYGAPNRQDMAWFGGTGLRIVRT
jgi:hypothetical protein